MRRRTFVALFLVTGAVATWESSELGAQAAPENKVEIVHIDVARSPAAEGGIIVPCTKVKRNFFENQLERDKWQMVFHLTYTSRGQAVTKDARVSFRDTRVSDDHPRDDAKFVFVAAQIDVINQPVDPGTTVTGTVTLVNAKKCDCG